MLVLSRMSMESVVIDSSEGALKVTVLEIRNGKVKLGFEGDPAIHIRRSEVSTLINPGLRTSRPR